MFLEESNDLEYEKEQIERNWSDRFVQFESEWKDRVSKAQRNTELIKVGFNIDTFRPHLRLG